VDRVRHLATLTLALAPVRLINPKIIVIAAASGLLLIGVALTGLLLYWRSAGKEVLAVQTSSMMPIFQAGDAVLVDRNDINDLQTGQIVAYRSSRDGTSIVSHRLVARDKRQGTYTFRGDALKLSDPTVRSDKLVGRVIAMLPAFGFVLKSFRSPGGIICFVYLPSSVLLGYEIQHLLRHFRSLRYRLHGTWQPKPLRS
jgi:signal peptidase I